jgi:exodeoxyribonuclease VII small subunit
MAKKSKDLDFETAYEELTALANNLQSGTVSIDDLSKSVARANELITFCKNRLRGVEKELDEVFTANDAEQ